MGKLEDMGDEMRKLPKPKPGSKRAIRLDLHRLKRDLRKDTEKKKDTQKRRLRKKIDAVREDRQRGRKSHSKGSESFKQADNKFRRQLPYTDKAINTRNAPQQMHHRQIVPNLKKASDAKDTVKNIGAVARRVNAKPSVKTAALNVAAKAQRVMRESRNKVAVGVKNMRKAIESGLKGSRVKVSDRRKLSRKAAQGSVSAGKRGASLTRRAKIVKDGARTLIGGAGPDVAFSLIPESVKRAMNKSRKQRVEDKNKS